MDINALPLFEPLEKATEIDHGKQGIIYRLDNHLCVKIRNRINEKEYEKVQKEAGIADDLYRGGVSVSRSLGLFRFSVSSFETLPSPLNAETFLLGFVQEFIYGSHYCDLPKRLHQEAEKKHAQESDKAEALGFRGFDNFYSTRNVLYQVENDSLERAVLIDFGLWVRRT